MGEDAEVFGHEIGNAGVIDLRHLFLRPIARLHAGNGGIQVGFLDRGDHLERFRAVIDRPVAAPLRIRQQEGVRDIEIAVGSGVIIALALFAAAKLLPGHEVVIEVARMRTEKRIKPIKARLRLRIVPGEIGGKQHAVAVAL